MLNQLAAYFTKMFDSFQQPQTYQSELERYIVSKNPQTTHDVDYWTKQYDKKQNERGLV